MSNTQKLDIACARLRKLIKDQSIQIDYDKLWAEAISASRSARYKKGARNA